MYLYKSLTGQTFSIGRFQVSNHTGLALAQRDELLDSYVAGGVLDIEATEGEQLEQAVQAQTQAPEEVKE